MVIVFLDKKTREGVLDYDVQTTEHSYDRDMYYITHSEKQILHDIIDGMIGWEEEEERLKEFGFKRSDIDKMRNGKFKVEFTDKKMYIEDVIGVDRLKKEIEHCISDLEIENNIIIDYKWNFVSEEKEVPKLYCRE